MRNYILSDGRPMSVPLDKEEEFLKQLEKQGLTATLESDELGKSQGAGQPQINQQEINTESKLENGSLELPENKLKEIDNKQVFNFKTNDKDFWSNNKSDAVEQMKEVFGSGDDAIFEYKDIGGNQVELVHRQSGNSTTINFDIGLDEYKKQTKTAPTLAIAKGIDLMIPLKQKQEIYDKAVEDNSSNLFSFLGENLKEWEYDNIKDNQQKLIDDYKLLQTKGQPLHLSADEVRRMENQFDIPGLFDPVTEKELIQTKFGYGTTTIEKTTQPYQKELDTAKQSLIKSGVQDPNKKQVYDVARRILKNKGREELYDKKFNLYMNSKEVEGKDGIINQVKLAARLSNDKDAKELIKLNTTRESKFKEIEASPEFKRLRDFRKTVNDKNSKIDIREGEETVTLQNGKVIPKSMYDNYNSDLAIANEKYDSLNKWLEDNNDKIEKLEDSEYKNDLVQRNYDDFEKFIHNIGSGFDRIFVGGTYGTVKGLGAIVGIDSDAVDNVKLDYDEASRIYSDEFQKDIEFDDAFDDMFSFGKFVAQEFGNQIPIFATLAIPYVGIPALGISSAGDNWSEMVREDRETGSDTSTLKKLFTSAGYGTAEVIFDRWITRANMYRSFRALGRGQKPLLNEGWEGVKYYAKNNIYRDLVQTPLSEMASEGFTTVTQNVLRGRPISENLDHSLFSGGMFGTVFGGTPFLKGVFMNKFSTNEVRRTIGENQVKMEDIQQELLWAKEAGASKNTIQTLENQLAELEGENQQLLESELDKVNDLDNFETILQNEAEIERLRARGREINKDDNVDDNTRKKILDDLTKKYNLHLNISELLKDPKVNRSRFRMFSISEDKDDKKRRDDIFQKAYNSLVGGNSYSNKRKIISNPTDAQVDEEARLIYNTQEINKSNRNKTKTGFGKRFKSWSTLEKAIFEIEKMDNVSDKTKAELIEELKQGAHGANIPTIDPNTGKTTGKFIKFQVVENMAKDDRLETKTHELGHDVLSEIISSNPEAFGGIAEQILEYTKKRNPALYLKLSAMSQGLPIDEVITNFMELVVESDLKSSKNKGLGPLMAWMFGDAAKKATNSDINFDFRGETDAVNFITQLARKIKSGEVDIKSLKESKIAKEAKKRVEGKDYTPDSKFSKPIDAKPYVDELTFNEKTGKTYTKEEWDDEGANIAIAEIKKKRKILEGEGYLDKLIAAKYKVKPVPESFVNDVIGSTFFINHVRSFNPEINDSLYGWINPQIRNKAGSVFNKNEQGKLPKGVKTVEADARTVEGQPIIQVEDVSANMETLTDNINYFETEVQPENTESKAEQSKLRKEIGIGNLGKGEIFKKVRIALATSKAINEEGFLKDFEKNLANLLEPTIARILNDPAKLKKFRKGILEAIPIKTLVQMQKFLPEKIFIKDHGRQTNLTNLSKFVEKGLLPADILNNTPESKKRRAAGVRVYERLDTTTKQFENYIDAPVIDPKTGKRSGTRGNNRAKVISEVAKAIGKDATPETLTPEFVEDYLNIKDLKGKITTEKVIENISEQIERPSDLKFSKRIQNDYTISPAGIARAINQKLVPGSGEGRNLNAVYNEKTGETFFEARNRVINDFVEENPQYKEMLRKGLTGGKRSLVGTKTEFNKYTPVVNVEQVNPSRLTYTDKRRFDTKALDKIKTKKWKDNEAAKLKALEGFFVTIQNHLKTNPNNAWLFLEMLRDSSAAGQNHIIRILAPFKFYAVQPGTNKPVVNKEVVEEHTDPQNQIGTALMYAAIRGDVKEVFSVIGQSYMQGSLLHTDDVIIGDNKLGSTMPDIYFEKIIPRLRNGSLKLPDGMSSVVRMATAGINLNNLMLVDSNQTISEFFGVNRVKNASEFIIENQNDLIVKYLTGEITKKEASKIIEEVIKLDKLIKISKPQIKKSNNTRKAHNNLNKYSKSGKSVGMSTFDFDDTLARTKSGVRYTMPNPEGTPAPQRKVIFLAGGAGSGKSNVVKQLGLEKQGFKIVNQDISLEWLAKNSGLPSNMRDFTPEQASKWGSLQWEARDIAQKKQMKFQGRGDGIIVDGTGASKISMGTQVMKFKNAGYDVQMIFVETSLDVALDRNRVRKERSLKDFIVERNWKEVQANKKAFKEDFGDNFAEVNTDNLKQGDAMPTSLINKINKFTSGYIKGRLTAEEFASRGDALLQQGAEFDFSEFNQVVDGTPGPLLEKARNRAEKYGTKDMFVLTARPQQSAFAIQQFLKGQGLNIPIGNITGLANSTGEAKANWMLEKFAEGYNDMYFVDDALQNVKAVKDVLNQLDIKSKVVQAKIKFSKSAPLELNKILEQTKKVVAGKVFSAAEARKIGIGKGKNIFKNFFVPPSAEDFKGFLYAFIGKGEQGNAHAAFFKENLLDPFAKGIRDWNTYKQAMSNDYKALKKQFKGVGKRLNKKVKGTPFTNDNAIRVYLWNKAGFEIPGLSDSQVEKLVEHVENDTELKQFAEGLSLISRTVEGYIKPNEFWSIESIASDLNNIVRDEGRKDFLAEWINNKNIIFSPDNLNKIEAIYGTGFRNELEKILYRMETGRNRLTGKDAQVNWMLDWINGSVGAVMFFNMRSATLQTISMANFINMSDNNPVAAAAALANAPQFIKDFVYIFNSDMLKQRRAGLQMDVSASELTRAFVDGKSKPQAIIHWLLEKGFTPTQIADSFAIAAGGAPFYRNRLKAYLKQGMSESKAKEQAWLDFQEVAEETQQSSRPDLISNQQAGPLGRLILAWQNTPMQMTRLMKKKLSDFINRRRIPGYGQFQSDMANISGIAYYGLIQNIYFGALQTGLMFMLFGWDDDEERKSTLEQRVANGALDSILRGTGIYGAGVSTLKNVLLKWKEEREKPGWKRENMNIAQEAVNLSPPLGTKMRKIMQAVRTEEWNKGVSKEIGWRIENPNLSITANWVEALTNLPVARIIHKANNIEEALTGNHQLWQKVALISGWSKWSLGVEDEELEKAKVKAKEQRVIDKKTEKEEKKKQEEIENKKKGIKTVRCSGIRSNGKRCSLTTQTKAKNWKCVHHAAFKDGMDRDGDGIKEYRCKATTGSGKRCKNKTENKNKRCYAHQ